MFKYKSIAEDIQNKIYSGEYPSESKLPQETELCKIYDSSRITVREALDHLVRQGLITRRRGAGTFVKTITASSPDPDLFARSQQFSGFTREMQGRKVESDVHEFSLLRAPKNVAEKLRVPETAFVCYICRTRIVDGEPYVVEYTYMPTEDEYKWLDIKKGEMPVLEVEQTAYLDDGRIFEYSKSRHRADRFTLYTVSVR